MSGENIGSGFVKLRAVPGVLLEFHTKGVATYDDVGGHLWPVDRVMAEYLVRFSDALAASVPDESSSVPSSLHQSQNFGTALVLGCGGVPFSGLVASALGWNVILTDLQSVLPQVRENVRCNLESLRAGDGSPTIRVEELPWGDDAALTAILANAAVGIQLDPCDGNLVPVVGGIREGPLLVLCSDVIYLRKLHRPLLETICSTLAHAAPGYTATALVAAESRDPFVEQGFLDTAKDRFGLQVDKIDLSDVLPGVQFTEKFKEILSQNQSDFERFVLYKLTLQVGSTSSESD